MKKIFQLLALIVVFAASSLIVVALSFPSNDSGINIGTNLDTGYEPSGVVWHERLQSLFVVWDNGYVTQMDLEGNILHSSVFVGGDLEGITIVNDQSNYIYLLEEYPQKIVEFDISTWTKTGKSWLLKGMTGTSTSGAEALTYNSDYNLFYAGSQFDGKIYVYSIDLSISGSPDPSLIVATGIASDLAGLAYLAEVGRTYAVFDASNRIQEYDNAGTLVAQYDLPGVDQEGVTLVPDCANNSATLIIAQDSGGVIKYGGYPIVCPVQEPEDLDQDGYNVDMDCDDSNAEINAGMMEITNDGFDNDCNLATPDWVKIYDYKTLIPYKTTEVREDYHVFDAKTEFSYIKLPSQSVAGWYSFELNAKATTLSGVYSLGVYVRNADGRFTETRVVDDLNWNTYKFYYFIPANTPTEVRFISGVRGTDASGLKREHHLKSVAVSRIEETIDPMVLPLITSVDTLSGLQKVSLTVNTDVEASNRLLFNGILKTDTDLVTSKTWILKNLTCGTTYEYEVQIFSDLYHPVLDNGVSQKGSVSTAACL